MSNTECAAIIIKEIERSGDPKGLLKFINRNPLPGIDRKAIMLLRKALQIYICCNNI